MMSVTTMRQWGNSQGVLIPKALCVEAGIAVGDRLELSWDADAQHLILEPERASVARTYVDLEQLFEGWEGHYERPEDLSDGVTEGSHEAGWGHPVGDEMW